MPHTLHDFKFRAFYGIEMAVEVACPRRHMRKAHVQTCLDRRAGHLDTHLGISYLKDIYWKNVL
jgi:hypothetical protein